MLQALGLKSGGTLRQRAERLFLTKHTPLDKLDPKHFARGAAPAAALEPQRAAAAQQASKEAALAETKVSAAAWAASGGGLLGCEHAHAQSAWSQHRFCWDACNWPCACR